MRILLGRIGQSGKVAFKNAYDYLRKNTLTYFGEKRVTPLRFVHALHPLNIQLDLKILNFLAAFLNEDIVGRYIRYYNAYGTMSKVSKLPYIETFHVDGRRLDSIWRSRVQISIFGNF